MCTSSQENVSIIIHNNPAKISDAPTIAHEIAHVIAKDEGYPFIGHYPGCVDREVIYLCKNLGEMIHDPLVIKKLLSYGFNLQKEYADDCVEGIKAIKKINKSGIERIRVTFFFTQLLLEQDLIFEDETNPCYEYIQKLGAEYPDIMAKSREIYRYINQIGYDTPRKVRIIFDKIFEIYPNLRDLTEIYQK